MASIAYDNSITNTSSSSWSLPFTVSGTNTIVFAKLRSSGTLGSPTLGGVAPTGTIGTQGGTGKFVYWLGVAAGSPTIACTQSGTSGTGNLTVVSYNGVSQSGFPDAGPNVGTGNITVTSASAGAWAVYFAEQGTNSFTPTDTTRQLTTWFTGGATNYVAACDSNGSIGASGTTFTPASNMTNGGGMTIVTIARAVQNATASESDSIMNADSRFVTIISIKGKVQVMSDSMMNSVSRLATIAHSIINNRGLNDSIMNAVSRFVTVTKMLNAYRILSDSIMNAVGRFAILIFNRPPLWKKVAKPIDSNWNPIEKGNA